MPPCLGGHDARERASQLLHRVLGVDGTACPRCGGRMHLHAVVLGRALSRVLAGLEAAHGSRAPPALA